MPTESLSAQEIEDQLRDLPGWSVGEGGITRTYRLASHFAATALVIHVAQTQEELNHHSSLTLGYNTVTLTVNTHDAGGAVTAKDFALARRIEAFAPAHRAN